MKGVPRGTPFIAFGMPLLPAFGRGGFTVS